MCGRTEGTRFLWIWIRATAEGLASEASYYERVWCHGTFQDIIDDLEADAEATYRSKMCLSDLIEVATSIESVGCQPNSLPDPAVTWHQPPLAMDVNDPTPVEPELTRVEVTQSVTGAANRLFDEIADRLG